MRSGLGWLALPLCAAAAAGLVIVGIAAAMLAIILTPGR